MCGICGFLIPHRAAAESAAPLMASMLKTLYQRGPDDQGQFISNMIALGMRRLAVIDADGGKQPFQDRQSGVVLVYNGEIYNHQAIRQQLEKSGHCFNGHSDTEVVLRCYLQYGESFVTRLNGMFAIAIWDPRNQSLLLARDHLGQKPLYYWQQDNNLAFASDMRTLLCHPEIQFILNQQSISDYLRYRHVPGPQTIIRGIQQLPPANTLRFQNGDITIRRYWQPHFNPDMHISLEDAADEFSDLLQKAVERHLICDVPLGAFLSGGIDSCLITAAATRATSHFKTISIAFDDQGFDETPYALEAARALGSEHQVISFEEPLESLLDAWSCAYDQPFSDPAAFPSLILARETRKQLTVVLTGDGGDELFAGYQRYRSFLLGRKMAQIPAPLRNMGAHIINSMTKLLPFNSGTRNLLEAASRRLSLVQQDGSKEYLRQFWSYDELQLHQLLKSPFTSSIPEPTINHDTLTGLLKFDLEHWLPDQMLVKTDRATMAFSLEARLPFLDREIVDFSLKLPTHLHIRGNHLKRVLREAARRQLPANLVDRPKHGFAVPVNNWIRKEQFLVSELLHAGLGEDHEIFNKQAVLSLWQQHREGKANHGERLLSILLLLLWQQRFQQTIDRVNI